MFHIDQTRAHDAIDELLPPQFLPSKLVQLNPVQVFEFVCTNSAINAAKRASILKVSYVSCTRTAIFEQLCS